jgi:hypothetical protein
MNSELKERKKKLSLILAKRYILIRKIKYFSPLHGLYSHAENLCLILITP